MRIAEPGRLSTRPGDYPRSPTQNSSSRMHYRVARELAEESQIESKVSRIE